LLLALFHAVLLRAATVPGPVSVSVLPPRRLLLSPAPLTGSANGPPHGGPFCFGNFHNEETSTSFTNVPWPRAAALASAPTSATERRLQSARPPRHARAAAVVHRQRLRLRARPRRSPRARSARARRRARNPRREDPRAD